MRDPSRLDAVLAALDVKPPALVSRPAAPSPQLPSKRPAPRQQELFTVETRWFPVLRALVESGVMARIGPMGIAAYIGLKANAELHNGQAVISAQLIAEQVGMSPRATRTALKLLEVEGLVNAVSRPGCQKVYQLVERIPLLDSAGTPAGEVTWDFSSLQWKDQLQKVVAAVQQLAENAAGTQMGQSTVVNIGTVNINVLIAAPRARNTP